MPAAEPDCATRGTPCRSTDLGAASSRRAARSPAAVAGGKQAQRAQGGDDDNGNAGSSDEHSGHDEVGQGSVSGVVSELTTFWTVKPGQEEGLRAGIQKFMARVASLPRR